MAPVTLTTMVPNGKPRPARDPTNSSTANRNTDPHPPISTTPAHTKAFTEAPTPNGRSQ